MFLAWSLREPSVQFFVSGVRGSAVHGPCANPKCSALSLVRCRAGACVCVHFFPHSYGVLNDQYYGEAKPGNSHDASMRRACRRCSVGARYRVQFDWLVAATRSGASMCGKQQNNCCSHARGCAWHVRPQTVRRWQLPNGAPPLSKMAPQNRDVRCVLHCSGSG